eukprot:g40855.t1
MDSCLQLRLVECVHVLVGRAGDPLSYSRPGKTSMFGNKRGDTEPLRGDSEPSDGNMGWIEMKDENHPDEDEIPISIGAVAMNAPSLRRPRQTAEPPTSAEQKHATIQSPSLADPIASPSLSPGDSPPRLGSLSDQHSSAGVAAHDEEEQHDDRVIPSEGIGVDGTCIQSRDFIEHQSQLYQDKLSQMNPTTHRNTNIKRWFLTILIGCAVAIVGICIGTAIRSLFKAKNKRVQSMFNKGEIFNGFLTYLVVNACFALFSGILCVYIEPAATGSGMSDLRCGLNGMRVPRAERLRVMFARSIGVITTVASSLPAGMQGPMVHIGSSIAASISQGQTSWWKGAVDISCTKVQAFRNDYEKRDFMACGAAAGIACAFRAPIGGVLFMLEAGSTFWHLELTWRAFFSAMTAAGISTMLSRNLSKSQGISGDMVFGDFHDSNMKDSTSLSYQLYELPLFLLAGLVFGAAGALWVRLCAWMYPRMRRIFKNRPLKIIEVLLVSCCYSFTTFVFCFIFADWHCEPIPKVTVVRETYIRFTCPKGNYNEAASLSFQGPEGTMKQLFHSNELFELYVLIPWFVIYFFWSAVIGSGIAISAGSFVQLMINGALMGRIFGQIMQTHLKITVASPGNWALIGAAALLGGASHLTISVSTFLIEATGDVQFGLPLMVALAGAKVISERISLSMYDIQIRRNKWPFLAPRPHPAAQTMQAGDVMNVKIPTLRQVCEVGAILDVLSDPTVNCICIVMESIKDNRLSKVALARQDSGSPISVANESATSHTVFHTLGGGPTRRASIISSHSEGHETVIDIDEHEHAEWHVDKERRPTDKRFCGIILRKHLQCILHARAWTAHRPLAGSERPTLTWDDLEKYYPHYPQFQDVEVSEADRLCWVDLSAYMDRSPHTVFSWSPLVKVYPLFREMGLRHLPVLNGANDLVGLITRKSLTHDYIEAVDLKRGQLAWTNRKSTRRPRKIRRWSQRKAKKDEQVSPSPAASAVSASPAPAAASPVSALPAPAPAPNTDQTSAALGDNHEGKRLA